MSAAKNPQAKWAKYYATIAARNAAPPTPIKINGYDLTVTKITEGTARGQWRAAINDKTVAISRSKRAATENAKFVAQRLTAQAFDALVSPDAPAAGAR